MSRAKDVSINTCDVLEAQDEKGKESRRGWTEDVSAEEQEGAGVPQAEGTHRIFKFLPVKRYSAAPEPWG